MSGGTQVDLDWAGVDPSSPNGGYDGQAPSSASRAPASAPGAARDGAVDTRYLSDEEILGIDAPSPKDGFGGPGRQEPDAATTTAQRDSSGHYRPRNDNENKTGGDQGSVATMPSWMQAIAADPKNGAEAQQLWQEHQAFRAAFSSPAEARAVKEMFPGGVTEVQELRQASQSVERIDAAIFSGDARAQSEVVAELAAANPAAFRSLFSEAAKVLGVGQAFLAVSANEAGRLGASKPDLDAALNAPRFDGQARVPVLRDAGSRAEATNHPPSPEDGFGGLRPVTDHQSSATSHPSQELRASQSPTFDPVAYSNFERSTNDVVARDVRSNIHDTLARVLPDGVAEGAARRIGDDIFNEIHRALAGDRALSEQVGAALRASVAAGQGWRFGAAEQQRISSLLAGRAKQLVPSVARRVIGEWTSSVLGTARSKAARQAAASSRVDIAAAGGTLDSMPIRAMSPREVNYASMSDDEILGM